jgi:hypothetical protein
MVCQGHQVQSTASWSSMVIRNSPHSFSWSSGTLHRVIVFPGWSGTVHMLFQSHQVQAKVSWCSRRIWYSPHGVPGSLGYSSRSYGVPGSSGKVHRLVVYNQGNQGRSAWCFRVLRYSPQPGFPGSEGTKSRKLIQETWQCSDNGLHLTLRI